MEKAGIDTDDLRLAYIVIRAELDGVICSGARRGKQFTYALLEERVTKSRPLSRDESLAELSTRYFRSHGPATLPDFVWWSGLTMADAKAGLEMVKSRLMKEVLEGQTYWFSEAEPPKKEISPIAYLLPNYDEYVVGYTDRGAIFDGSHSEKLDARGNVLAMHTLVIHGQIAGTWRRSLKKKVVTVELNPFTPLEAVESQALTGAAERYGKFLGLEVMMA